MPKFETIRRVHHTPENMFALVADIEKYPQFLPMCEATKISSRRERDGKTLLISDMTVGYKAIKETFTTQVVLDPAANRVEVTYIDGPFRHLTNIWRFEPDGTGCEVHFYIDYAFKSRVLAALMGTMFERAFRMFAEAFEKRADEIYGVDNLASG